MSLILRYKNHINAISIILSLVYVLYLYAEISSKNSEIQALKDEIINAKFELLECNKNIALQNDAIKKIKLRGNLSPLNTQKIEKIFIKDKSCKSELNAYKALFKGEK